MRSNDGTNGTGTTATQAGASPRDGAPREERVSIVSGDRFCTQCGYNLVGQSVLREAHYGMFIVRCPECATVASLQEYPLLGRWASRWATLFAVIFFILLLGAWAGSSAALFGLSIATGEDASRIYTRQIQNAYQEATAVPVVPPIGTDATTAAAGTAPITQKTRNQVSFGEWWEEQDPSVLLEDMGGWFGAIDKRALWLWLPSSIAALTIGTFWSVALLTVRRRYLPFWALALLAVAGYFVSITVWDWMDDDPSRSWRAGRTQIAPGVAVMTLIYLTIPLVTGLLLGRSVVRLLVRALLPPRLRYALALLWTTDGLEVPAAGPRRKRTTAPAAD